MQKVKVDREIFEALESFKKRKGEKFKSHLNFDICTNNELLKKELILRKINLDLLVDIAYCGYELKETKEEQLLRIYKDYDNHHTYRVGIKKALEILGYEIEGINK